MVSLNRYEYAEYNPAIARMSQSEQRAELERRRKLTVLRGIYTRLKKLENKFTILYAPKGSGKTSSLAYVGVWSKKLFHKRVVSVGSPIGFTPAFGKVEEISIDDFRKQLVLIDKLSKIPAVKNFIRKLPDDPETLRHYMSLICKEWGITIYDTLVLTDEMRKLVGRRKSMSNRNDMINNFMMQQRHYFITVLGTVPDWKELDAYTLEQLDWRGDCSYNQYTAEVTIDFKGKILQGDLPWTYKFNQINIRKYFKSHTLLGYPSNLSEIKGVDV